MAEKQINDIVRNKAILEQLNNLGINTLEELCSYSPKRLNEKGIGYVKGKFTPVKRLDPIKLL